MKVQAERQRKIFGIPIPFLTEKFEMEVEDDVPAPVESDKAQ